MTHIEQADVLVNDFANNGKRYTDEEKELLNKIAQSIETKEIMYQKSAEIALEFRRTEVAICKQIEKIKGWYWAQKQKCIDLNNIYLVDRIYRYLDMYREFLSYTNNY